MSDNRGDTDLWFAFWLGAGLAAFVAFMIGNTFVRATWKHDARVDLLREQCSRRGGEYVTVDEFSHRCVPKGARR